MRTPAPTSFARRRLIWTSIALEPSGSVSSSHACSAIALRVTTAGARRSSSSRMRYSVCVRPAGAPATAHDARRRVQRQVAHRQDGLVHAARPALEGADAREELAEVERLHEVVVRPGVQAADAVGRRVARREHEERGGSVVLPRPRDDVDPLGAGHPPVDDRDVVLVPAQLVDRVVAAVHGVHVVAGVAQPQDEDLLEAAVVLGDEDAHGSGPAARLGGGAALGHGGHCHPASTPTRVVLDGAARRGPAAGAVRRT